MSLFRRLIHALRPTEERPTVQEGADLRHQAEVVRNESERMVQLVNRSEESGIPIQDMIRGTYRVNRRTVRRGHP